MNFLNEDKMPRNKITVKKKLCARDDAGRSEETYCLRAEPVDQTQKNKEHSKRMEGMEGES
jgi:hypothetical protein